MTVQEFGDLITAAWADYYAGKAVDLDKLRAAAASVPEDALNPYAEALYMLVQEIEQAEES